MVQYQTRRRLHASEQGMDDDQYNKPMGNAGKTFPLSLPACVYSHRPTNHTINANPINASITIRVILRLRRSS